MLAQHLPNTGAIGLSDVYYIIDLRQWGVYLTPDTVIAVIDSDGGSMTSCQYSRQAQKTETKYVVNTW